jgi:hypothetical protein
MKGEADANTQQFALFLYRQDTTRQAANGGVRVPCVQPPAVLGTCLRAPPVPMPVTFPAPSPHRPITCFARLVRGRRGGPATPDLSLLPAASVCSPSLVPALLFLLPYSDSHSVSHTHTLSLFHASIVNLPPRLCIIITSFVSRPNKQSRLH